MTVYEAIQRAKSLRPSEVTDDQMLKWLSAFDGQTWIEIIMPYLDENGELRDGTQTFAYTATDNTAQANTGLLIPEPYDQVYVDYLVMRIDLENDDYERYNNRAALFNSEYKDFTAWYNRTHVHVKRVTRPSEGLYETWMKL